VETHERRLNVLATEVFQNLVLAFCEILVQRFLFAVEEFRSVLSVRRWCLSWNIELLQIELQIILHPIKLLHLMYFLPDIKHLIQMKRLFKQRW